MLTTRDEGFHLLLVGAWDNDLSLEILSDWVALIDEDGWVGREQILGDEARSKVPQQFWTQYPHYANPPTLAMAVTAFIGRLRARGIDGIATDLDFDTDRSRLATGTAATADAAALANRHLESPALARAYLQSIYPALRRHYHWFRRTQRGQIAEWGRRARSRTEAYRWRGRDADHVLTSGLDDYPRASPPHVGELHLDLASWMAFFSRTMAEIAAFVGEDEDRLEYEHTYDALLANIEDLHWSEERQMYCDASVDEDGALLSRQSLPLHVGIRRCRRAHWRVCKTADTACRRIVSRLPPGLHLALPAPAWPPAARLAPSRRHARPPPRSGAGLERLRHPQPVQGVAVLRPGREARRCS